MLPTLFGRIQTRIFLLATIGSLFTFIMASILPATLTYHGLSQSVPQHVKYQDAFVVLFWVAVFGVLWECVYHFLMQWRWEKDWPSFFGFATFINEGLLIYFLVRKGTLPGIYGRGIPIDIVLVPAWFFWIDFLVVWIAVWVWANGPMRVFNIHWRFFGGRLV
jgi:hypothetical protein